MRTRSARPGSERLGRTSRNGRSSEADALAPLIRRVAAGDRAAFEEVYRLTAAKLFPICLRMTSRRQEAEEALQDAYLGLWQRADRFDAERGSAMAWLAVLTRNAAIDRGRAHRHGGPVAPVETAPDPVDPAPLASDALIEIEDALRLREGLDGLNTIDAAFLRAAFFGGRTYADLAREADLPLGTVKSRIRRALVVLRERLG